MQTETTTIAETSDRETSDRETSDRETSDRETSDRETSDRETSDRETSDRPRTRLKPLGDRILVLPDEPFTKTKGGLYIPDPVKHRPLTGTVIAVGNGLNAPKGGSVMELIPGDRVVYGKGSGIAFPAQDAEGVEQEYLVMRQSDIFFILTENGYPNEPLR